MFGFEVQNINPDLKSELESPNPTIRASAVASIISFFCGECLVKNSLIEQSTLEKSAGLDNVNGNGSYFITPHPAAEVATKQIDPSSNRPTCG